MTIFSKCKQNHSYKTYISNTYKSQIADVENNLYKKRDNRTINTTNNVYTRINNYSNDVTNNYKINKVSNLK